MAPSGHHQTECLSSPQHRQTRIRTRLVLCAPPWCKKRVPKTHNNFESTFNVKRSIRPIAAASPDSQIRAIDVEQAYRNRRYEPNIRSFCMDTEMKDLRSGGTERDHFLKNLLPRANLLFKRQYTYPHCSVHPILLLRAGSPE